MNYFIIRHSKVKWIMCIFSKLRNVLLLCTLHGNIDGILQTAFVEVKNLVTQIIKSKNIFYLISVNLACFQMFLLRVNFASTISGSL